MPNINNKPHSNRAIETVNPKFSKHFDKTANFGNQS